MKQLIEIKQFMELVQSNFENGSTDKVISVNPCPSCNGTMSIGEENAGGVCMNCYFKYSDHDSSTGE